MDRFARIVLGYHGCEQGFADALVTGQISVAEWRFSENVYDWLGHGIYFWEHAPERARTWSEKGGVVGAVIQLGLCLDFTDVCYTALLGEKFGALKESYLQEGRVVTQGS